MKPGDLITVISQGGQTYVGHLVEMSPEDDVLTIAEVLEFTEHQAFRGSETIIVASWKPVAGLNFQEKFNVRWAALFSPDIDFRNQYEKFLQGLRASKSGLVMAQPDTPNLKSVPTSS